MLSFLVFVPQVLTLVLLVHITNSLFDSRQIDISYKKNGQMMTCIDRYIDR